MAKLLDTVRQQRDGGGYVYDGEVVAAASAMAEGSEGEAMGESDDVQGRGARRGRSSSSSAARAASCWRRGELTLAGVTSLPALARAGS